MRTTTLTAAGLTAALGTTAMLVSLLPGVALAADTPPPGAAAGWSAQSPAPGADSTPDRIPAGDRAKKIGSGYRASKDRAWTTSGDATGFHLLVADAKDGYAWKTAATLYEPGFDTDAWIGNACVTRSGKRAAVAYAPRTFTNKPELMVRGAFTAVVDLTTGQVTKLPYTASLAYFSPGCGAGEKAVFSQLSHDGEKQSATRLIGVDAATGRSAAPVRLDGQVTSAVPTDQGIVAAHGNRLVRVGADGAEKEIARTGSVPFQLRPDRSGGVTFIERVPDAPGARSTDQGAQESTARRVSAQQIRQGGARPATLARGPLTDWDLSASADGTVYVTGRARTEGALPAGVENPGTLAKDDRVSTLGAAAVGTTWAPGADAPLAGQSTGDESRAVRTRLHVLGTDAKVDLETFPGAEPVAPARIAEGGETSPALPAPSPAKGTAATGTAKGASGAALAAAGSPTDPVEAERMCAVPRGDVRKQALQPTPRQVEWAVDQAVIDGLYKWANRPANWNNTGMSAYSPQVLFPLPVLHGDPNGVVDRPDEWHIPAQILLGVTAQESNMWQAARTAVPGVSGNSLIGNYYGISYSASGNQADPWAVNWAKADCGYGITQVTDGMRLSDTQLSTAQKEAAALDYSANIAYGAQILASKWNETRAAGMTVNGGKPKYIENWFFALWAYNSGFHPQSAAGSNGGKWGVGWTNNPANPLWKENRPPFLEASGGGDDYSHAAHPQDWPYQEKVIGWAARPISALFKPDDMQAGYRAAWWNNNAYRTRAKPPNMLFCTASNDCDMSKIVDGSSNQTGKGPCTLPGDPDETNPLYLKCWWHEAVTWKNCEAAAECGNAVHRFNNADYPEQPNENSSYPPACSSGLPAGTLVVDDVPNGVTPMGQPGHTCGASTSAGSFSFTFADSAGTFPGSNGTYPGKIDLHQIGAGYGDHFFFTHTRKSDTDGNRLYTEGTWKLGKSLDQWVRIMVHVPDHGAHTQQAAYQIDTGSGSFTRKRVLGQKYKANTWVTLGVYKVTGTPRVKLGSRTLDGTGDEDVAWDAVAFQPLAAKPKHIVAVLGDSFTSGEGAGSYSKESDKDHGTSAWNACRRSANAWSRKLVLPGTTESLGAIADSRGSAADLAFVACSGAMTKNVAYVPSGNNPQNHNEGQFGEIRQVDSGVLSDDTTLVMLTLGGNDEGGFASAMMECGGLGDCSSDSGFLPKYKKIVDRMIPDLQSVIEDIAVKAPKAKIVLMGYPELLSRSVKCAGSLYYDMPEVGALAELVNYADGRQKAMTDSLRSGGKNVEYADPVGAFVGHSGCDDPEWINKFVIGPNGDGDFHLGDPAAQPASCLWGAMGGSCISRESFHPKNAGTSGYAGVMSQRLAAIGYTGTP
ncbi:SGNH/GDSL hydrolase family protein [Streptomyces sp. NPDC057540]|uniref:SGNH/GDSL hydrolase family protein n=1 Tax=Streptomyces sp. NPDC057540 TaxID=3346160 RepID=UPI00369E55A7